MATEGNPKAQRVVLVAASGARIEGGPARPIKLLPAGTPHNGAPVLRVAVVTGRATVGGPALACVEVSGSAGVGGDVLPVVLT